MRLVDARTERRWSDETVRGVGGAARLANDELLQVDPVGRDLEERRLEEGRAGLVNKTFTVSVEALCVTSQ